MLPIILIKGWGRVLIDTGATNTIVDESKVINLVNREKPTVCKCTLTTVSGEGKLLGNFLLDHKALTGYDGEVRVHVARLGSRRYDIIVGADLLQDRGCRVVGSDGGWVVKIGKKTTEL